VLFHLLRVGRHGLQDAGEPSLTSERQLQVEVADENDCRPMFTSDEFVVPVRENSAAGLSVFQLSAVDADLPGSPNSRLTYSIRPKADNERPAVAVEPVSKVRRIQGPLGAVAYLGFRERVNAPSVPFLSYLSLSLIIKLLTSS